MNWQTRQSDKLHLIDELLGDQTERMSDPGSPMRSTLIKITAGPTEINSSTWLFTGRIVSYYSGLQVGNNDVYVWIANSSGQPSASMVGKYVGAYSVGWRQDGMPVWIVPMSGGGGLTSAKISHVTILPGPPSRHTYTVVTIDSGEEFKNISVLMYRDDTMQYDPLPVNGDVFIQTWTNSSGTQVTSIITPLEQMSSVIPNCLVMCYNG